MIELSNEFHVGASPAQVWDALVDFAGYPRWNPYVAIRGVAGRGSEIEWSLGSTILKRRIWAKAQISEFDAPNVLEWSFGSRAVFVITERFELEAAKNGTRLQHKANCRGMFISLAKALTRRRVEKIMTASDNGLCRFFEAKAEASKAAIKPVRKPGLPPRKSVQRTRRKSK